MRNYEFRGRRLGEKDFVYGSLKQTGGICEIVTFDKEAYEKEADKNGWDIFDYTNEVTVDAETVGQYTGLTDKNGNKIWEGDVNEDLGYVFWNKDFAAFQWRYPNGDVMEFEDEKEWCIIIGNIFDNPELLTK
jgi:uncharacterized phage protein (TIGR01671 family)